MRRICDIIIGLICIPIGFTLFVCVSALATVLWIPYFIWLITRALFFSETDDDFIEFIFICYGLGVTCLIAPFGIIESGINI